MQHTAVIGPGLPPVTITFNCADPLGSVTQTYGPGTYTDMDTCAAQFVSATVGGVPIPAGGQATVRIGGVTARADVKTDDQGRHITVTVVTGTNGDV